MKNLVHLSKEEALPYLVKKPFLKALQSQILPIIHPHSSSPWSLLSICLNRKPRVEHITMIGPKI